MNVLSYTSGSSTDPLLGATIGTNLDRAVAAYPDSDALVVPFQDVRLTYEKFGTVVERLARAFVGEGLRRGDRIGIWSPNCAEWVLVQYATAKAGLILVNPNPAYRTAELEYALCQSGCRMLIAAQAWKSSDYPEMVADVAPRCPELEATVFLGSSRWQELLASAERVPHEQLQAREVEVQFDDPVNIQYTSGTTGSPKGATLSHHNILNNAFHVGAACGYTSIDRICIPVPFYHCFGMVMGNLGCTSHGATMVVPAPAFDASATLRAVRRSVALRCTACRRCSSPSSSTRSSAGMT